MKLLKLLVLQCFMVLSVVSKDFDFYYFVQQVSTDAGFLCTGMVFFYHLTYVVEFAVAGILLRYNESLLLSDHREATGGFWYSRPLA